MLESKDNNLLVSHCSQLNKKTQDRARKEQSLTLLGGSRVMHQSLGSTSQALQQQEGRKTRTAAQILHQHHSKHLQGKARTAQGHSEQAAIPK